MEINNFKGNSLKIKSANTKINLEQINTKIDVVLENNNALMNINNSNIEGNLLKSIEECYIESKVDIGNNNLPSGFGKGAHKLKVNVNIGNINISFK